MGPRMRIILAEFWENQEVVTRKNGHRVPQLRANCGTNKGSFASPTLSNVTPYSVVLHWLLLMVKDVEVIHYILVHVVV